MQSSYSYSLSDPVLSVNSCNWWLGKFNGSWFRFSYILVCIVIWTAFIIYCTTRDLDQISYIYVKNDLKSDKKCSRGIVFNYVHYSTLNKLWVLEILLYEYLKANVECNQVNSNILSIEAFLGKIIIIDYY